MQEVLICIDMGLVDILVRRSVMIEKSAHKLVFIGE
jgi:hypothetical protein